MSVKELVFKEQITISVAPEAAGVAGTYLEMGRIKGDVSINDGRETTTIMDWSTARTAIADKIAGGRNVSVSFNMQLVPGDTAYAAVKAGYKAANTMYLKVVLADTETTPNTETDEYRGIFTQFNRSLKETDAADVSITFEVSDEAPFS